MSSLIISVIIDKKDRYNKSQKLISNHPGYVMNHVSTYLMNYCVYGVLERLYGMEKLFDSLFIIKQGERVHN